MRMRICTAQKHSHRVYNNAAVEVRDVT